MLIMLIIPLIEGVTFWLLLRNPNEIAVPKCPDNVISKEEDEFSFRDKIRYMSSLLKYMIPIFLVYFAEYLINQGLVSMRQVFVVTFLFQFRITDSHLIRSWNWFISKTFGLITKRSIVGFRFFYCCLSAILTHTVKFNRKYIYFVTG